MSLAPGTTIGPYEIVGVLGAGGMGEVYRAKDVRLGRHVAVKVLPDVLARDPGRRARFAREAHVLASLNHQNISTLHGIEESDGHPVLVMELVEGETLRDRLARAGSPLPWRQAVLIARQVLDGLDAAHERGIVHRDLKPDNIALRADGTVKILDFGLAKVVDTAAGGPAVPASTITDVVADAGAPLIGTVAYMSPEQVRGEPVDAAADVWAFGCVLYEMLTGRQAFRQATTTGTLAAILEDDPDYGLLPPATPLLLVRLVRRCLEKDRRSRLRNIADARAYLDDAGPSGTGEHARIPVPARGRQWAPLALAALAGALAVGLAIRVTGRTPAPRVTRTAIVTEAPSAVTITPDKSLALTHDGTRLLYAGNDATQIFVRPLDALASSPIVAAAEGTELRGLAVSPDDQWVAYVENSLTLKKAALSGGPAVRLLALEAPYRGGTWASGHTLVFATAAAETGLQQVPADGGAATVLTVPDATRGEADHVWPEMLPDGRHVLFTILATGSPAVDFSGASIAVLDLASGSTRTLLRGGRDARYVSSGHLLYAADDGLRAVPFDLRRVEVAGASVPVAQTVAADRIGSANFSVSGTGTLAYVEPIPEQRRLVWVDRAGAETPLPGPARDFGNPRVSPRDDRHVAATGNLDIWTWPLPRDPVQLTFTAMADWMPLWMPDGERVVFGSWSGGNGVSNLYMQAADGTAQAERLTDSPHMQMPSSILPDGSGVLYTSFGSAHGPDVRLLRLGTGGRPHTDEAVLDSPRIERHGAVSPDMRWLAYDADTATAPGRTEVFVRPYPVEPGGGVWQVSTAGGIHPLWSRKGDELFYRAPDGAMMAVRVDAAGPRWRPNPPVKLFHGPYVLRASDFGRQYDVVPDGTRFLMVRRDGRTTPPAIVLVQHLAEELTRRGH